MHSVASATRCSSLPWLIGGTRPSRLACDNDLSVSTAYHYLHEGLTFGRPEHRALLRTTFKAVRRKVSLTI